MEREEKIIDVNLGLRCFANKKEMYRRCLNKFLEDTHYADSIKAYQAGDMETYKDIVHALKGMSGTLGCTLLFQECIELIGYLKEGNIKEIPSKTKEYEEAYEKTIYRVKELIDELT